MKKRILLAFVCFLIGFGATLGVYLFLTHQRIQVISPLAQSLFSLERAPSSSIKGHITQLSGQVLWQGRTPTDSKLITAPQEIQQGEQINTGTSGNLQLVFDGVVNIRMNSNAQLAVIQTLPANIVLEQPIGMVTYEKLSSSIPVSVRGLDLLVNIDGTVEISVNKDTSLVTLSVASGAAKIAYTDTSNVSQVKTISQGKKILFNNNTKTISQ